MTLLAAFEALLHRYTGQKDFAIGTPIANRTDEKLEPLIGFFVNTLALRANVEGNPSFVELLARVQKEALGGYAHQAVPFERLVDELGVARDLSRNALFQVMFVLQNARVEALALAGLTFEGLPLETTTAKFDVTLAMEERGDELTGLFEYASESVRCSHRRADGAALHADARGDRRAAGGARVGAAAARRRRAAGVGARAQRHGGGVPARGVHPRAVRGAGEEDAGGSGGRIRQRARSAIGSSTSAAISSRITCRRWAWGPKCASASASSGPWKWRSACSGSSRRAEPTCRSIRATRRSGWRS